MTDDLRVQGLVPNFEPYTDLGFSFDQSNTGCGYASPAIFDTTGNNAVVDWVLVELRSKIDPSVVVASRTALLLRQSKVVDVDGVSALSFKNVSQDEYFVVVRHRNHLGVMSGNTLVFDANTPTIDFSDPFTVTFGTDAQNNINGNLAMWSGNSYHDNDIKYAGLTNDRDPILVRIGGLIPTAVEFGYYPEDVNMDGFTKYGGLFNDRDEVLLNIGGQVPTQVKIEQLP